MENRIKDYSISGNSIILPRKTGIEDVRLIYNETQKVLICSTAKKDNLSGLGIFVYTSDGATLINVPTSVCVLQPNDMLTIKCDYGDEGATESTLTSAKEEILTAVKKGAQESTLLAESEAIKQAIASAKPEVDLSGVAKEATIASILSALNYVATSMYKGVSIVSQAGDATIAPNVWNVWGGVTALTITKGAEIDGVVNSYLIRFTAGEGCAITFDGFSLNWYGGSEPTWKAGSIYEINIVDNLALWAEFTPSES